MRILCMLILGVFLINLSFVYAFDFSKENTFNFPKDDLNNLDGVTIINPLSSQILIYNESSSIWYNSYLNNSGHSVNVSDYWNTGDHGTLRNINDILHSWLNTQSLLWSNAGHTIDTTFDMNGNNIIDVGNITPTSNNIYSLGSQDLAWKDLYVSSGSVHIGDAKLTSDGTSLVVEDGNVTGNYIFGDGSQITNLNLTNISFGGDTINATTFNGDNFFGGTFWGNLTNFSILQGINNVSINNLDFNRLNFNALNSFFNGNITVNSINITSPNSIFLAGVEWSEETVLLAGFNFSTILVSNLKYFTIGDDLAGQELGFQTQNFNSHPNSSSYIATVNSNGLGNGIFKFSSAYNPYPDWSVYFNNKGLTNFYGYYNESEEMNTSNSGVYFGLASNFNTGENESVVGYQDELFNAYYTKDNFTFFTNTNIEKNLTVKENTIIEGDLNVKGNSTINLYYGEMWNWSEYGSEWTFPITSAGVYYNLTNLIAGELNGFNFTSETQANGGSYLTATTNSIYSINAHLSYEGALAGGVYGLGITHNFNVDNHRDCYVRDESKTEVHGISITCLMDVQVGDKINLQVENEDAGRDMIINSVNLNFVRIGN